MSGFKEKVLSEISFAMVDDVPDLQKLHDKISSIDEQPQLDDDQKNELKKLKNRFAWFGKSASHALFDYMTDNDESCLNNKEFAGILSDFAVWVLEQEANSNGIN